MVHTFIMKYFIYAITTIRDAIAYNEHSDLNGDALDRIEKELNVLEEIEDKKYTKEQFEKFHLELLELNVALLPTTKKAIKRFENTKNVQPLAISLTNLSEVYFQREDYTTALKFADSSKGLIENLKLQRNYGRIYNLLGRIHKNLGNESDYQYYLEKEREIGRAHV